MSNGEGMLLASERKDGYSEFVDLEAAGNNRRVDTDGIALDESSTLI